MTLDELRVTKRSKGFTKAQLAQWGVSWPPVKGWKKKLLRRERIEQATLELNEPRMCTKCKTNEAFWSADWCDGCLWEFVKE